MEFDNENEAEDARDALNKKDFGGQPLNLGKFYHINQLSKEWSKKSKKFDDTKS
jgi:hypothetical protein